MSAYESRLPYHTKRMHAAAVYCSDGRVGEQYDDFLHNGLNLPRYDRLALPRGPAALLDHARAGFDGANALDELKFLVEGHQLDRVVLIQHEDCAFYKVRLGAPERTVEELQHADLARLTEVIREVIGLENVEGYFARRVENGVRFEAVTVDSATK